MNTAIATQPVELFLQGRPETMLGAAANPKILITWLHTNEELAPRVAHHIYAFRPDLVPHVDYICGNPRTAATDPAKGFSETDLNRSFNTPHTAKSYEEKQAAAIQKLAKPYDYVLDLHTAVGNVGNFIIVSQDMVKQTAVRQLIAASRNQRVIVMPGRVARTSLIGAMPNAIALEYFQDTAEAVGLPDALYLLENLATGKTPHEPFAREFYFVTSTVPKTEDPGPQARNFQYFEPGGYYPIMLGTGPRSYREDPTKDYCCFAATRRDLITL